MKEVIGNNLSRFFEGTLASTISKSSCCEVWKVPNVIYEDMLKLKPEVFARLAGEDAWVSPNNINIP